MIEATSQIKQFVKCILSSREICHCYSPLIVRTRFFMPIYLRPMQQRGLSQINNQRRSCCDWRFMNADNLSSSLANKEPASELPLSCFSKFEMSARKSSYSGACEA